MPSLVRFSTCESSVFVSYAHADDELNNRWISNFVVELQRDLEAALARENIGRPQMPGIHLSAYNGPVSGDLAQSLQARVAQSFAMVIVVDEKYATSEWCGHELRYFADAFGGAGLDQRLYIVALRRPPMQAVAAKPQWQRVFAGRNPVWREFVDADDLLKRPVSVLREDGRGATKAFLDRYQGLFDDALKRSRARTHARLVEHQRR